MPRILHLPKWYPHRYDNQDGDFVARHVAAIAANGGPVQAAVVFATVARGPLPTLLVEEADLGGPVPTWRYYYRARPTGLPPLDRLLKLGLWLLAQQRGLRAVRRHWGGARPEVVHAHVLFRPAAWAWWLRWRHDTPYVLTEHWTIFQPANVGRLGWLRRWLVGQLVRRAVALTPVSADLGRALAALGGVNAHTIVIPNVVDTELFCPPTEPGSRGGLLHVAAFNEPAKNLGGLLRTVAQLVNSQPGLRLRVAGYGPAEAALHRLAQELGLLDTGIVTFLGKLPPAQVAAEMRRAACLVLFSNYENLPCVLIEAQASGLPAVATSVGGVPELLPEPSLGLLVPPGDEVALAQALREVLAAPAGRFDTARLRARAVSQYSYPAVGRAFGAAYARILGQ
ncbi:glycosyltransferase [Hymenobacter sp. BT559]|uniref:glycosyltransferase n=1 Tax=Hymenobacter sp. BT559 TaxID=2795729 RepID=UPI0018ED75A3|nr:glycosyltransferase [Hymenobacter sp. BT559]MBJ6143724.1 glycosyltransferase [Hymenobacter sp. BT559]